MGVNGTAAWRRLGDILVDDGLVDEDRVQAAVLEQALTGDRLGEILLVNGWISAPDLINALAKQQGIDLRSRPEGLSTGASYRPGEMALGRLLVERGEISEGDLEQALESQYETGLRLGEVLRGLGMVSTTALAHALAEQQGKRCELMMWSRAQSDDLCRALAEHVGEHDLVDVWFELHECEHGTRTVLFMSRRFVDTAEVALAVLTEWGPEEMGITRVGADRGRLCWRYPSSALTLARD